MGWGNKYTSTVIRIYDEDTGKLLQKQCSKCGQLKDISEFSRHKKHLDGLQSYCKNCKKEANKEYREANKDRIKERRKEYREANPGYMKEYYEANRERWKEHYENNKESILKQHKDYMKKYRQTDKYKEKHKEYNKERGQTPEGKAIKARAIHKRRALKKGNGGSYTKEQWNQCLEYFNHCDAYTGEPLTTTEIEHVIPVSKGGTTYIYNIVPANGPTNRSKGNKDLWEWYSQQEYFDWNRYLKICLWIIKKGGVNNE